MDRYSSDEDQDHQKLIPHNDIRHNNSHHRDDELQSFTTAMATNGGGRSPRSAFQIEETLSRSGNRRKISFNKRYIVAAVSLTLLLGFFFFLFTDTTRSFFSVDLSSFKLDPLSVQAKESELRALKVM